MQLKTVLKLALPFFLAASLFAQAQDDLSKTDGTPNNPPECSGATPMLQWTAATKTWSCVAGGGGGGISTLNTLTAATQTFSRVNDTNVNLSITSATSNHEFALSWAGTLAKNRTLGTTVYTDQANTFGAFSQDFESASVTRPFRRLAFASFPGSCTTNREFLERSDPAVAGQVVYVCNAAGNGWDLVGDGGGAGGGASTADTFVTVAHDADLTGERVATAGSAMNLTDGGANGNLTFAFNPLDNSVLMERDDFCGGSVNANGQIGELGWAILLVGTSGVTGSGVAGTSPNLCIERLTTSVTTARGGTIALATSSQVLTLFGALGNTSNNWDSKFRFAMSATASTSVYVGYSGTLTSVPPVSFIGLRFDTAATSPGADSAFRFVVCKTSVCSAHGTTFTADTAFHTARIRSLASGEVALTFDGGSEICFNSGGTGGCTASANVPTASVDPYFMIVNQAGAAQTLDADFFGFIMTGLSR